MPYQFININKCAHPQLKVIKIFRLNQLLLKIVYLHRVPVLETVST